MPILALLDSGSAHKEFRSLHSVLTSKRLNKLKPAAPLRFMGAVRSKGKPLPKDWRVRQIDMENHNILQQKSPWEPYQSRKTSSIINKLLKAQCGQV